MSRFSEIQQKQNSYLVAEQPGWKILLSGIILALFVGFIFRQTFSTQRITSLVNRAALHINSSVQVKFESAELSLAQGIWPDLSIVIKEAEISSTLKCWGSPILKVKQIRLPLSIRHLISAQNPISQIRLGISELSFDEQPRLEQCSGSRKPSSEVATPAATGAQSQVVVEKKQSPDSVSELKRVFIQQLIVKSRNQSTFRLDQMTFRKLLLDIKSQNEWQLESQLGLVYDQLLSDDLIKSQVTVKWNQNSADLLDLKLKGSVKEGQYQAGFILKPDQNRFLLTGQLQYLPLSEVIRLIIKMNIKTSLQMSSFKNNWLSTDISGSGELQNPEGTLKLNLTPVKLESEQGEIYTEQFLISHLNPLQFETKEWTLRNVNLENLIRLMNPVFNRPESLSSMGVLNGRLQYKNASDWKLKTVISGFDFIFANKNQRAIQSLSSIEGDINGTAGGFTSKFSKVSMVEGYFLGALSVEARFRENLWKIRAQVQDLALSSSVQKLITNQGRIENIKMDFSADVSPTSKVINGLLQIPEIEIEKIKAAKIRVQIKNGQAGESNGLISRLTAENVEISDQSPLYGFLKSNLEPDVIATRWKRLGLVFKTSDDSSEVSWSEGLLSGDEMTYRSSGSWKKNEFVAGQFSLTAPKARQKNQSWLIEGTRGSPVLRKTNN